jgi:hypothetical protein
LYSGLKKWKEMVHRNLGAKKLGSDTIDRKGGDG